MYSTEMQEWKIVQQTEDFYKVSVLPGKPKRQRRLKTVTGPVHKTLLLKFSLKEETWTFHTHFTVTFYLTNLAVKGWIN